MEIYRDLTAIQQPFLRAHVTIGNFDGVHLGHQKLFEHVVSVITSYSIHYTKLYDSLISVTCREYPLVTTDERLSFFDLLRRSALSSDRTGRGHDSGSRRVQSQFPPATNLLRPEMDQLV